MRNILIGALLICVAGCNQIASETTLAVVNSTEHSATLHACTDSNLDDKVLVGTVARVEIDDNDREKNLNDRLHFCVFDDGDSDYIYVGTKYGMWSRGQFDLTIDDEKIFTGFVEHLVCGGVVIQMGDVLTEQPKSNIGVHVTRVTGMFK